MAVKMRNRKSVRTTYENIEDTRRRYNDFIYNNIDAAAGYFYAGIDPRRRTEMADGGMVKEDRTAMANLSNEPVHREYSATTFYDGMYRDNSTREE